MRNTSFKLSILALVIATAFAFVPTASADTCATTGGKKSTTSVIPGFDCDVNGKDNVHLIGSGTDNALPITQAISGGSFQVTMTGNVTATEMIIIAAFPTSSPTGTIDGISFTSLSSFPEGGALGAINSVMSDLHVGPAQSFGYVILPSSALSSGGTLNVTYSGLPTGTILYGLAVNGTSIVATTPNSEAGFVGSSTTPVPEPGTLGLLGTGLIGLAGMVRRRFTK